MWLYIYTNATNKTMVDTIVCINLKERHDKYNSFKKTFEKLNIPVEYYFADKHPFSGRIGCFESHIHCIQNSYDKGNNLIMIFEDDAVNTPSYDTNKLQFVVDFMKKNDWCEYFQLGYTVLPHEMYSYYGSDVVSSCKGAHILKYNGNTTHAYSLNRKGMERALDNWKINAYEKDMHIDFYYKDIFVNYGASICPMLFDHNFCIQNDNDKPTDYYYSFMRNISCVQHNFSLLYWFSLLKFYLIYVIFGILLIFILCIYFAFFNNYRTKYLRKKMAKPFA